MTVPEIKVSGKKFRLGMWAIRVAYLFSIGVLAYICIESRFEQQAENRRIIQLSNLADDFDLLEDSMSALSAKAKSFSLHLEELKKSNSPVQESSEKNGRINPELIPIRSALLYHQKNAQKLLQEVEKDWAGLNGALRNHIITTDRFRMGDEGFKFHNKALDQDRVTEARTIKDMYWVTREIYSLVDNAATSNTHAITKIRQETERISARKGQLIERVYFYNIIALLVILLGVFLPVDVIISRMIKRLAKERNRAARESLKAAKADKAKSEFLANMSHEIRTPMNGVLGMAELLAKTDLNDQQRTYTDIVVKSGEALLTIINDVLDYSKIDAGHLTLESNPFNIAEVVEDVASLEAARVAEKGLELSVRIDQQLPGEFIGDSNRIRQIVTNLVGNAVKFTEEGQIEVDLSAVRLNNEENKYAVTLKVKDTGIGIPEDELKKIFDKFSQVDGSSTRKHEGTGLGLAIVSLLIKEMGGNIEVKSEIDQGSEFCFTVPLDASAGTQNLAQIPEKFHGFRAVIVDDNEVNRSILTEQLKGWGLDAASCNDGSELIAIMHQLGKQNYNVDLIVLDYQMPGMDGAEVARVLQQDAELSRVPIIMLTSVDRMDDGSTFNSLDIEAYLTKPVRSASLLKSIVQVLETNSDNSPQRFVKKSPHVERPVEPPVFESAPEESVVETITPGQNAVEPTKTRPGSIDILLAEDNEVNQIVFTQLLNAMPYTYAFADNGEQAIEMYQKYSPKMICMDISMPVMNGMEATRRIRSLEEESSHHTPIIAVTANAMIGHRESFLAAGMDDYLSKPVSEKKFSAMISKWMGDNRVAKAG